MKVSKKLKETRKFLCKIRSSVVKYEAVPPNGRFNLDNRQRM